MPWKFWDLSPNTEIGMRQQLSRGKPLVCAEQCFFRAIWPGFRWSPRWRWARIFVNSTQSLGDWHWKFLSVTTALVRNCNDGSDAIFAALKYFCPRRNRFLPSILDCNRVIDRSTTSNDALVANNTTLNSSLEWAGANRSQRWNPCPASTRSSGWSWSGRIHQKREWSSADGRLPWETSSNKALQQFLALTVLSEVKGPLVTQVTEDMDWMPQVTSAEISNK